MKRLYFWGFGVVTSVLALFLIVWWRFSRRQVADVFTSSLQSVNLWVVFITGCVLIVAILKVQSYRKQGKVWPVHPLVPTILSANAAVGLAVSFLEQSGRKLFVPLDLAIFLFACLAYARAQNLGNVDVFLANFAIFFAVLTPFLIILRV